MSKEPHHSVEINKELVNYCRNNLNNLPVGEEYEKMISSVPYNRYDKALSIGRASSTEKAQAYQDIKLADYDYDEVRFYEARLAHLKTVFGKVGGECLVEPPFYVDYGCNIELEGRFYANFGCTFLDCTLIKIGAGTALAPNVSISTATHPTAPNLRKRGIQYAKPVTIGRNCWLGTNSVVNPGVTIGDNVVVGAGGVVTQDIPSNCIVVGVPAKVLRFFDASELEEIIEEYS